MNITDVDGKWRITYGCIENRKTGEVKTVRGIPSNSLASMNYNIFLRKCSEAFATGIWPIDRCSHCNGTGRRI